MNQTESESCVQDEVRRLYESLPYPPPVTDLEAFRDHRQTLDGSPQYYYHLYWPHGERRDDLDILVAGCGTSQAAKLAIQQPDANVTGIDISSTSLRCTEALIEKYSLKNLILKHLPIECVGELEQSFDLIICTGVLHHLPDPDAGLGALRGVLKQNGAMHLMVYARYGRAGVYMMQEYCRRLGVQADDDNLRDLLGTVRKLPADHPLTVFMRNGNDLLTPNGTADALLHPRDCAFTVQEIHDWLERCGMSFARWFLQAPYWPQCGLAARSPHAARLCALPDVEQHAAMELYRGTMITHTFVACRDDCPAESYNIDFATDAWLDYVPTRFNGCKIRQDKLPEGVSAILSNVAHVPKDLALGLNRSQTRLFQAVDERSTIRQILQVTGESVHNARSLFELLWRNDLVLCAIPG